MLIINRIVLNTLTLLELSVEDHKVLRLLTELLEVLKLLCKIKYLLITVFSVLYQGLLEIMDDAGAFCLLLLILLLRIPMCLLKILEVFSNFFSLSPGFEQLQLLLLKLILKLGHICKVIDFIDNFHKVQHLVHVLLCIRSISEWSQLAIPEKFFRIGQSFWRHW